MVRSLGNAPSSCVIVNILLPMQWMSVIRRKGWLLAIPLFFSTLCLGQSVRYSNFYDLNEGAGGLLSVTETPSGQFIAVGSSLNLSSNSGYDEGHHVVVDENGVFVSEFGLSQQEASFRPQAVVSSESGVYSSGYYCGEGSGGTAYCDFYVSKLDDSGDTLFTRVISRPDTSDFLLDMVQTTPNKILLIGWTYNDIVTTNADLLFITVDTLGNELNRVVYGGSRTDYIHSGLVINENGDVLMAGYTASFNGSDNDSWVIKTDSVGNVQWQQVYNHLSPNGADASLGLSLHPDGNYVICGAYDNDDFTKYWGYLMKVDINGDEVWTKRYSNDESQGFYSCSVLTNHQIVASGQTDNTIDGSQAGWLVKADENGDTLWTHIYNPSNNTDLLRNMLVLDNGDIVMVGFGRGENSTNQDGWILRVDSLGCLMEGCHTVGINEQLPTSNEQYLVYPNPATDVLNVEGLDPSTALRVTVVDFSGREILTTPSPSLQGGEHMQLDVSGWAAGFYLLSVTDENGNVVSKRVVKE